MPLPPWMSRAARAMSSALPQLLRFRIETISAASALIFEPPEPQAGVEPQGDLGLHVHELLLDQLIGGKRATELAALEA